MKQPKISIIIPSFNQGRFIERTLLSILNQDYDGGVEIIVSDGGSTDETVDILKKYNERIVWWSKKDKGYVDAVNKGLEVATGEVIGIQSSDDFYLANAFKIAIKYFDLNPTTAFVSGGDYRIDLEYNISFSSHLSGEVTPYNILFNKVPQQHSTFVKRVYIEKVNFLRSSVDMCADMDLWYRISHFNTGIYIDDYLAVYQYQPNQRTQTSTLWYESLKKMVLSLEDDPNYNSRFHLSEGLKKDLFIWWQINWASKNNIEDAIQIAKTCYPMMDKFPFSLRTINSINYWTNFKDNKATSKIKLNFLSRTKNLINKIEERFKKEEGKVINPALLWWQN